MTTERVIIVSANTYDLLSDEELSKYPGTNLSQQHFDTHLLVGLLGARQRIIWIRDGATEDAGPTDVEEAFEVDTSDIDLSDTDAEEQLARLLHDIMRADIDADVAEYDANNS